MNPPPVNQASLIEQYIHPIDILDGQTRQPTQWKSGMKLLTVTLPFPNNNTNIKRKYKVRVTYLDQNGKQFNRTIFFGDQTDYVFNKDKHKRVRRLLTMKNLDNPLNSNYWKAIFLNKRQSMTEGICDFVTAFYSEAAQQRRKDFKKKQVPPFKAKTLYNGLLQGGQQ